MRCTDALMYSALCSIRYKRIIFMHILYLARPFLSVCVDNHFIFVVPSQLMPFFFNEGQHLFQEYIYVLLFLISFYCTTSLITNYKYT